jgi:hypothetical protein
MGVGAILQLLSATSTAFLCSYRPKTTYLDSNRCAGLVLYTGLSCFFLTVGSGELNFVPSVPHFATATPEQSTAHLRQTRNTYKDVSKFRF